MITMYLSEAAQVLNARWAGEDVPFRGCGTDTRTLASGTLFAALRGEHFDGHEFLEEARRRGAAAALVEGHCDAQLPTLVVRDSRRALGDLAAHWRERFDCPLVAVTGSNGKTTVKEMLTAILAEEGPVLSTRGNLNNDIGMPLTLFNMDSTHRFVVLEMGANHVGEIARLARIASPSVGLITQCAPAHLEGFGSIEAVARAKGELIEALDGEGAAVINADDAYADLWTRLAGRRRRVSFGLERPADVSARYRLEPEGSRIELATPAGEVPVRLSLPGRHNVMNALAGAATAVALGVPLAAIQRGLESVRPVDGRVRIRSGMGNSRIVDDTYNANPTSLAAGLSVLDGFGGRRWLVLGDMAELGESAAGYHEQVGRLARDGGVDRLYATGPLSRSAVEAFGPGARHYPGQDALIDALRGDVAEDVTLLVKGSRSSRMDRVVDALKAEG